MAVEPAREKNPSVSTSPTVVSCRQMLSATAVLLAMLLGTEVPEVWVLIRGIPLARSSGDPSSVCSAAFTPDGNTASPAAARRGPALSYVARVWFVSTDPKPWRLCEPGSVAPGAMYALA